MLNINLEIVFIMESEQNKMKYKPFVGMKKQQVTETLLQNIFLSKAIIKKLILKRIRV